MEVSEVRRRLRAAIESARQAAAERRTRADTAQREYEAFLAERAIPVVQQVAAALTAEGHPYKVFTPAGAVRLASQHSAEEFIELTLDGSSDPPEVMALISRGRGRRKLTEERPLRAGAPIAALTAEDVVDFFVSEVVALVER